MKNNYETPELLLIKIDYDVLTASDNDAPFTDNDSNDDLDWGEYY